MQYWEKISEETTEGFQIVFSAGIEDMHPRDLFDDSITDISELCEKIDRFDLVWFVARVECFKNGILLASEYLGGCLYESYKQFFEEGDYYLDMREAAILAARVEIRGLLEGVSYA